MRLWNRYATPNIDPNRIVLRGFSMGGAGSWHLGLHHPDRWAAMEAGAGFVETRNYAKLRDLPEYQAKPLHIYDALDYALNAFNLPVVGYGGEDDPQLKASQQVQEAARQAGADGSSLWLVGVKTAHKWHPESQKQADAFIDAALEKGKRVPERIRFVTYTTRYNRCFWLMVDALDRHYERSEVEGSRQELKTTNIAALTLENPGKPVIDGQQMKEGNSFEKREGKWRPARPRKGLRKLHGLQGPIDDAFGDSFVVAGALPEREKKLWAKWMRGDLRTGKPLPQDHLVLFGDPVTNPLIKRINSKLPVRWSGDRIVAGSQSFTAADHT
ncbi:MAG: alpha/beta hydrolase-fold protein, partial [Bryobacteraceae bacterium]